MQRQISLLSQVSWDFFCAPTEFSERHHSHSCEVFGWQFPYQVHGFRIYLWCSSITLFPLRPVGPVGPGGPGDPCKQMDY